MNYNDLTIALALLAEENDASGNYAFIQSPDFTTYLPTIIGNSEARCYREVCPLATRSALANGNATAGQRTILMSAFNPQIIVLEGLALISPLGYPPAQGERWQYRETSLDFIDSIWPKEATAMAPSAAWPECYWAMRDSMSIVLAPTPDLDYLAEATGTIRPTPLSAANVMTYLSLYYPDVFLKACMVETCGFQRDYSAQADDPKVAMSWESAYQIAKVSAIEEEKRRRGVFPGSGPLPATAAEAPIPGASVPAR